MVVYEVVDFYKGITLSHTIVKSSIRIRPFMISTFWMDPISSYTLETTRP
jgi:hypothetical protein